MPLKFHNGKLLFKSGHWCTTCCGWVGPNGCPGMSEQFSVTISGITADPNPADDFSYWNGTFLLTLHVLRVGGTRNSNWMYGPTSGPFPHNGEYLLLYYENLNVPTTWRLDLALRNNWWNGVTWKMSSVPLVWCDPTGNYPVFGSSPAPPAVGSSALVEAPRSARALSDSTVADMSALRFELCKACPESSEDGHSCRLHTGCCFGKIRAMSETKCPLGKW